MLQIFLFVLLIVLSACDPPAHTTEKKTDDVVRVKQAIEQRLQAQVDVDSVENLSDSKDLAHKDANYFVAQTLPKADRTVPENRDAFDKAQHDEAIEVDVD